MMTSTQSYPTKAWSQAIFHTAIEFGPTALPIVEGAIPAGLRGSLYRNGPGRLERGGQRVQHWFDGDGGILGLHITDADATGLYRYVKTAGYVAEEQAGKFLLAGYGMLPPGQVWERFGKDLKNAANTSVLALPDRLLALWEGGLPHALTLDTLETLGLDDLGGTLPGLPYSAHYKRDHKTGDIFNFGVSLGLKNTLHLYRSDRTGAIQQQGKVPLDGLPLIHDFAFADRYLVFCISPVRLNVLPVMAFLKSYSDAMAWHPEKGTEILVIDRETLEVVSRGQTEPWFQWHYSNAFTAADGSVVVSFVRFPDFQTNQNLKEVATGAMITPAIGTLWQLRLDPQSGKVLDLFKVLDRGCEFPVVQPEVVGQPWRYTYLAIQRRGADAAHEMFGAIGRVDHQTGALVEADLGENRYPSEPIYVADAIDPAQAWILTVVYDGNTNASEAWIYDADRLDDQPVCRIAIPSVIPFSFHGTWKPT